MILPGFPMPLSMGGAAIADPFDISGSWETGLEGWALNNFIRVTAYPRTGSYSLKANASNATATMILPGAMTSGLLVRASVYMVDAFGEGKSASLRITRSDSNSNTTTRTTSGFDYSLWSTEIVNSTGGDVTVEIIVPTFGNAFHVDDWRIEGLLP